MCAFYCVSKKKKKFESPTSITLQQQRGANVLHKAPGTQFIDVPTSKPHYCCSSDDTPDPWPPQKSSADWWEGAATHQLLLGVPAPFLTWAGADIRKRIPFPKEIGAGACTNGKHRGPRPAPSQPLSLGQHQGINRHLHTFQSSLPAWGIREVDERKSPRTSQARNDGGKARVCRRWGGQAGCLPSATFPGPCEARLALPSLPWKSL